MIYSYVNVSENRELCKNTVLSKRAVSTQFLVFQISTRVLRWVPEVTKVERSQHLHIRVKRHALEKTFVYLRKMLE